MNVDIYKPRLDIPFKKGIVPKERFPISGLRKYWKNFIDTLATFHVRNGDNVRILEVPLWQITEELVGQQSPHANIIYIPHKMQANWRLDERIKYYMQMVIPNIFSIDSLGWCASASNWPISSEPKFDTNHFDTLSLRISQNISKFNQPSPNNIELPSKFLLFPCQIPHDETIRFHSDVSVEQSLDALIHAVKTTRSCSLVIKGHPVNPNAMKSLRKIYEQHMASYQNDGISSIVWIDNISIHELIDKSLAVFTVNSGVGLESILHQKKVYTFGNADYSSVANKIMYGGSLENASLYIQKEINLLLNDSGSSINEYKARCRSFIENWYNSHYDCNDIKTFDKIAK